MKRATPTPSPSTVRFCARRHPAGDKNPSDIATRSFLIALLICSIVAGASTAHAQRAMAAMGMDRGPSLSCVFTQQSAVDSQSSRIVQLRRDGTLKLLSAGFAAAAEPTVSFDGRRVLFAGKRDRADSWNIWELDLESGNLQQFSSDLGDCREPIYLARAAINAPTFDHKVRWISFTSTAPAVYAEDGRQKLRALYATNIEDAPGRGRVLWRTTYDLGGASSPTVLGDGRVLYSARQRGQLALMTISWAGENLNPLYGSHDEISQREACELPSRRRIYFVEADDDRGGALAQVSMRRPLHSHRRIAAGRYRTPQALPDGRLAVAHAPEGQTFGLYFFDTERQQLGQLIYDDPHWHDLDAQALAPRPEPIGRIPTVEFSSVLDIGGFKQAGQLQCLNVYDSDRPEFAHIERGRAKTVRLIEGLPRTSAASPNEMDSSAKWPPPSVDLRPLGEAPIEADGSFYINVAGDVPFYIETLDADGQVLAAMRSWIWVRSGDQRGCVGCHENKELAPENRATQALIRAQPAMLLGPRDEKSK